MKWLPNRGPVEEAPDTVQLQINHAGAVACLMGYLAGVPGWESTPPRELDDLARWLIRARAQYRSGIWSTTDDR